MTSKGILTIALAVLVFSVLPASAAMVSISGSPFSVDPGGTAFGFLNASGVTNLGSATVNLTYNPSVVIVTGVSAGSGNALNVPAFNINNVAGVVQIIANSAGGKGGNVIIANITFQAVGSAGQSSPLNITIREFIDTGFNPITASPSNGSFTITGTPTNATQTTEPLVSGYNLITLGIIPVPTIYAKNLLYTTTGGIPGVTKVMRWNPNAQQWEGYEYIVANGIYLGNNFALEVNHGYFIKGNASTVGQTYTFRGRR